MNAFRKTLKTHKKLVGAICIAIVILLLIASIIKKNGSSNIEKITAKIGTITQEIEVTGQTKPSENADLAFEQSGRIKTINVEVGDKVTAGQVLVKLDTSKLEAQLLEAQANFTAQKAKLEELKRGTRPEELAIKEAQLENAKIALENASANLVDKIQDSYAKSDDAVRNNSDKLFSNPRGTPTLSSNLNTNADSKNSLETQRTKIEANLNEWQGYLPVINQNPVSYLSKSEKIVDSIKSFLNDLSLVINNTTPSTNLTQTDLDAWKTAVASARTAIGTAIGNLSAADEKYRNAASNVTIAEKELILAKSGATPEAISAQAAATNQAEAQVLAARADLNKNILISPIKGVVSRQDAKLGEIVNPNSIIISVISENNLEIEANVPEIDIKNIAAGEPVLITFDALTGEEFTGKVVRVDPAETVVGGVVNFKVKITLDREDARLRSGLTSNLKIQTGLKENVLIIPRFAVSENTNGSLVKKLVNGKPVETQIVTGLRSQDGFVEVVSGLTEGDELVSNR